MRNERPVALGGVATIAFFGSSAPPFPFPSPPPASALTSSLRVDLKDTVGVSRALGVTFRFEAAVWSFLLSCIKFFLIILMAYLSNTHFMSLYIDYIIFIKKAHYHTSQNHQHPNREQHHHFQV